MYILFRYFEKLVFKYLSFDRCYIGIWFVLSSVVIISEAIILSRKD